MPSAEAAACAHGSLADHAHARAETKFLHVRRSIRRTEETPLSRALVDDAVASDGRASSSHQTRTVPSELAVSASASYTGLYAHDQIQCSCPAITLSARSCARASQNLSNPSSPHVIISCGLFGLYRTSRVCRACARSTICARRAERASVSYTHLTLPTN